MSQADKVVVSWIQQIIVIPAFYLQVCTGQEVQVDTVYEDQS